MKFFARIFFIALTVACAQAEALAQDQKEQKTGSVTGRVTIDGRAAAGVIVLLSPSGSDPARRIELSLSGATAIRTTTDENGNYIFSDVPAGGYRATTYTLSLVAAPDSKSGVTEREITVTEETLEGIDFALIRGGVITGRVTDASGRPMVRETISINREGDSDNQLGLARSFSNNPSMLLTDDRGVYRIYGLLPGKYFVIVGGDNFSSLFMGRKTPRTYHPGVADRARAKPVEVAAGSEATGVDIRISNS
ncbi:MAG: carboxypeptidase-like regulatory domain-containing protein, partial [Acidobacteriota bacterium]